jgi:ABC-type transport system involved in multi-copper enzyme maturation permease subunit
MRNIWIIAKREFDHYFISPIAYVVAFMILLTTGIIFAINIYFFIQNALQSFGQFTDI